MIFGVYRFMSMAIATCNTIGNSVATVAIAKWSGTFDTAAAERALYPERALLHQVPAAANAATPSAGSSVKNPSMPVAR